MLIESSPIALTEELHVWEAGGAASADALTAWVTARLAAHEAALAALLAVEGPRTLENSLRLYDVAIEQLNLVGSQVGVLNSVAADKAVRDRAQDEAQRVGMAGSKLSLNREVYDALAAIALEGASPATRHFVERTLLGYRVRTTSFWRVARRSLVPDERHNPSVAPRQSPPSLVLRVAALRGVGLLPQ